MEERPMSRLMAMYCRIIADGETVPPEGGKSLSFVLPTDTYEQIELLYQIAETALSDGLSGEPVAGLMRRYARRMGFGEHEAEAVVAHVIDKVERRMPLAEVMREVRECKRT